ncbi:MAG: two-component system, OmpR family, phosphate regulon sensor histidine kinase PhoR [Chthoniobacter sp.]|jgi:signal transduction histidine kinase|nr:two-component system, OmpR family, phosphate regulon sensor histidine kinase PhoR [Chthoniobacter sp.]
MHVHEIKPKQMRALLLLLVLVPFIPLVLMLRFMVDALDSARSAALERTSSIYQQALFNAQNSLEKFLAGKPKPPRVEDVDAFYRDLFAQDIAVWISENSGKELTKEAKPTGRVVARASLKTIGRPWQVQLFLVDQNALNDAVRDQFRTYAWTAGIAAVGICVIAAGAGIAVSRQLRLHELKNTSVATVAHELRTPLASMRMLVDTLREGRYRNEQQVAEYLDLIASENLRLSRLTDNFLTLSRLERNEHAIVLVPASPHTVIEQAVNSMRSKLEMPGCHFTLDVPESLGPITADRDALALVLANLLDNAVKYTADEKKIALRAREASGRVFIAVTDNGLGLSRAERKNVFKQFYQVDQKLSRSRGGCGLGLALVHHIVEAHGGRVDIESQLGRGSSFTVSIPLATAAVSLAPS